MPRPRPQPDAAEPARVGERVVRVAPMRRRDLDEVLAIERACFPSPWRREHFLHELSENPCAVNRVLVEDRKVVGYACIWCIGEELKINNIAIHPACRRRGLGRLLLHDVLRIGSEAGCLEASLEVRVSNAAAIELYRENGFVETGRRPNYYQLEREDAIVMARSLA